MTGELCVKGVVLVAAVDILAADRPRFERFLPGPLRRYLDDPPYAGDWYPVADLVALLEVIRFGVIPDMGRREAFQMMGQLAARRDLFGDANLQTGDEAKARPGAYEGALTSDLDFPTRVRRALALWQLYFDRGEQVCERVGERTLRIKVVGSKSPSEEVCWLTTGYFEAVVASVGPPGDVEHSTCSAHQDAECAWLVTFYTQLDPRELDPFGRVR